MINQTDTPHSQSTSHLILYIGERAIIFIDQ